MPVSSGQLIKWFRFCSSCRPFERGRWSMHKTAREAVSHSVQAEESILGQARVYRLRHSTSKIAQRSLGFQKSENRAKTAKEAHHETTRLHLCFPSTTTEQRPAGVSIFSRLHIYGSPIHYLWSPSSNCLLPPFPSCRARTYDRPSAKSLNCVQGTGSQKVSNKRRKESSRFPQEHELIFRNGVRPTYIIAHDEMILIIILIVSSKKKNHSYLGIAPALAGSFGLDFRNFFYFDFSLWESHAITDPYIVRKEDEKNYYKQVNLDWRGNVSWTYYFLKKRKLNISFMSYSIYSTCMKTQLRIIRFKFISDSYE